MVHLQVHRYLYLTLSSACLLVSLLFFHDIHWPTLGREQEGIPQATCTIGTYVKHLWDFWDL